MPTTARKHQLGHSLVYHIYNRGNCRRTVFHDKEDYVTFKTLLASYSSEKRFSVYHWVLMSNHYHLLAEIAVPERLSSIMAGIARSYSHYYHRKYKTSGFLWQGRFKCQPVQKELYFYACGRYIERNPVKAKMVTYAEDYPYSSASCYVFGNDDGLTAQDPLFGEFGADIDRRRIEYKEFLEAFNAAEEDLFDKLESPCGTKEFFNRLIKEKGMYLPRRRGKPRK
ncbi:MAG: transposase [Candidatus Omnitrophota bacterium]